MKLHRPALIIYWLCCSLGCQAAEATELHKPVPSALVAVARSEQGQENVFKTLPEALYWLIASYCVHEELMAFIGTCRDFSQPFVRVINLPILESDGDEPQEVAALTAWASQLTWLNCKVLRVSGSGYFYPYLSCPSIHKHLTSLQLDNTHVDWEFFKDFKQLKRVHLYLETYSGMERIFFNTNKNFRFTKAFIYCLNALQTAKVPAFTMECPHLIIEASKGVLKKARINLSDSSCNLAGLIDALCFFKQLEELSLINLDQHLGACRLVKELVQWHFPNLKKLRLPGIGYSARDIDWGDFKQLAVLDISGWNIDSLHALVGCSQTLRWLNCSDCVALDGIEGLSAFKQLTFLDLRGCYNLRTEGRSAVYRDKTSLRICWPSTADK